MEQKTTMGKLWSVLGNTISARFSWTNSREYKYKNRMQKKTKSFWGRYLTK